MDGADFLPSFLYVAMNVFRLQNWLKHLLSSMSNSLSIMYFIDDSTSVHETFSSSIHLKHENSLKGSIHISKYSKKPLYILLTAVRKCLHPTSKPSSCRLEVDLSLSVANNSGFFFPVGCSAYQTKSDKIFRISSTEFFSLSID